MNTRPTRAPAPPLAETFGGHTSTYSTSPENNLPAEIVTGAPAPAPVVPPIPSTGFSNLVGAIADVMAEIKPVEKSGFNKFQSYAYARIQDLMGELTPLMGKHGIVIFQNEEGRAMFETAVAVRYRFTVAHRSGEVWPEQILQTGLSNCRNSKEGFDDKTLNKCHTAARKYFLLSLFQIPTEDTDEADGSGGNGEARKRPQSQPKRPAPAPDGKMPPHTIAIINGEEAESWAKRFNAFIAKAETSDEIDKWYDANAVVFDKIKGRFQAVYDELIDYMDARVAKLDGAPADPISSGKPASDFPGDNKPAGDGLDIPPALDRRARPPITDDERDWIMGLEGSFSGCEDHGSLQDEFDRLMKPMEGKVSAAAWDRAVTLHDENIERIERNN